MTEGFYIKSQAGLEDIVAAIRDEKLVVLDTEFTRQRTYFPIPSIIQGAIKTEKKKQKFIIDCKFENIDLKEFFKIICDSKIKKILHSCLQDLQIFYRLNPKQPQGIFDTQIMASFCGFGFNVGYSNLVENLFDQKICKEQQRSDWQRRPLSEKQITYALSDVEFLHEIYEKFDEILTEKKRQLWLKEELENFVESSLAKSDESLMKNFSFRGKSTQQIAQLQNLVLWREEMAQKHDVLRQYFLKDEDIENIVVKGALSRKKLDKMSDKMITQIEEILQNSSEPKLNLENNLFLNEKGKKIFEIARNLVLKVANREKLPAQFLLTASDLKRLINCQDSFDKIINGWRYDLFGADLKKIINS